MQRASLILNNNNMKSQNVNSFSKTGFPPDATVLLHYNQKDDIRYSVVSNVKAILRDLLISAPSIYILLNNFLLFT